MLLNNINFYVAYIMNGRLWIIIICVILIYNIYYETNIFKKINQYKKYYKIGLIVIFGLGALKIFGTTSKLSYENMNTINQFIKVLPMDKNSKDMITPFLNHYSSDKVPFQSIQTMHTSGKKSSKRSVSETKKKYIASLQDWKCNKCQNKLSAWYEVDHKLRLERGGTNELDNLEALCRECHGQKTAMENL